MIYDLKVIDTGKGDMGVAISRCNQEVICVYKGVRRSYKLTPAVVAVELFSKELREKGVMK